MRNRGPRSGPGSEGSEGKVDGAFGPEGCVEGLFFKGQGKGSEGSEGSKGSEGKDCATGETTHWIFGSLSLPYKSSSHSAKYVRWCDSCSLATPIQGAE